MKKQLSMNECENIITGEVISLTAVMAIAATYAHKGFPTRCKEPMIQG